MFKDQLLWEIKYADTIKPHNIKVSNKNSVEILKKILIFIRYFDDADFGFTPSLKPHQIYYDLLENLSHDHDYYYNSADFENVAGGYHFQVFHDVLERYNKKTGEHLPEKYPDFFKDFLIPPDINDFDNYFDNFYHVKISDSDLLEKFGWTIECESPFEIRNDDGSFATMQAADCVLECCKLINLEEKYN